MSGFSGTSYGEKQHRDVGLLIAAVYRYKSECTKSLAVTLVLMPVIVQMVIMLVNGNLGTGVP